MPFFLYKVELSYALDLNSSISFNCSSLKFKASPYFRFNCFSAQSAFCSSSPGQVIYHESTFWLGYIPIRVLNFIQYSQIL